MSFVTIAPAAVETSATDLASIGDSLTAAHSAAAASTTGLLPAAKDEVSTAIAALFSDYGRQYQALGAKAALFQQQFVQVLNGGAAQYVSTEVLNANPLQTIEQDLTSAINAPAIALTGHPLIGNGYSGAPVGQLTSAEATTTGAQPGQAGQGGTGGAVSGAGGTTAPTGGTSSGGSKPPPPTWQAVLQDFFDKTMGTDGVFGRIAGYANDVYAFLPGKDLTILVGNRLLHLSPIANGGFAIIDGVNTINDIKAGDPGSALGDGISTIGDVVGVTNPPVGALINLYGTAIKLEAPTINHDISNLVNDVKTGNTTSAIVDYFDLESDSVPPVSPLVHNIGGIVKDPARFVNDTVKNVNHVVQGAEGWAKDPVGNTLHFLGFH